jgi:hypothetical protein
LHFEGYTLLENDPRVPRPALFHSIEIRENAAVAP